MLVKRAYYYTLQGLTSSPGGPTRRYRTLTRAGLLELAPMWQKQWQSV